MGNTKSVLTCSKCRKTGGGDIEGVGVPSGDTGAAPLCGIGIRFEIPHFADDEEPYLLVSVVGDGSPADSCGIRAGDKIMQIDGHSILSYGCDANHIVDAIIGPAGTFVSLHVLRREGGLVEFSVPRGVGARRAMSGEFLTVDVDDATAATPRSRGRQPHDAEAAGDGSTASEARSPTRRKKKKKAETPRSPGSQRRRKSLEKRSSSTKKSKKKKRASTSRDDDAEVGAIPSAAADENPRASASVLIKLTDLEPEARNSAAATSPAVANLQDESLLSAVADEEFVNVSTFEEFEQLSRSKLAGSGELNVEGAAAPESTATISTTPVEPESPATETKSKRKSGRSILKALFWSPSKRRNSIPDEYTKLTGTTSAKTTSAALEGVGEDNPLPSSMAINASVSPVASQLSMDSVEGSTPVDAAAVSRTAFKTPVKTPGLDSRIPRLNYQVLHSTAVGQPSQPASQHAIDHSDHVGPWPADYDTGSSEKSGGEKGRESPALPKTPKQQPRKVPSAKKKAASSEEAPVVDQKRTTLRLKGVAMAGGVVATETRRLRKERDKLKRMQDKLEKDRADFESMLRQEELHQLEERRRFERQRTELMRVLDAEKKELRRLRSSREYAQPLDITDGDASDASAELRLSNLEHSMDESVLNTPSARSTTRSAAGSTSAPSASSAAGDAPAGRTPSSSSRAAEARVTVEEAQRRARNRVRAFLRWNRSEIGAQLKTPVATPTRRRSRSVSSSYAQSRSQSASASPERRRRSGLRHSQTADPADRAHFSQSVPPTRVARDADEYYSQHSQARYGSPMQTQRRSPGRFRQVRAEEVDATMSPVGISGYAALAKLKRASTTDDSHAHALSESFDGHDAHANHSNAPHGNSHGSAPRGLATASRSITLASPYRSNAWDAASGRREEPTISSYAEQQLAIRSRMRKPVERRNESGRTPVATIDLAELLAESDDLDEFKAIEAAVNADPSGRM